MELMSRVISKLQTKFMKFCFRGWKREVSEAQKLSTAMLKMTRIYAYRSARELKTTVFISWKMFATLQAQQNEHKIRLFHVSHDNALVARFWSRWHLFVTLQWKERCKSNANDTPRDGSSETSPEDAFKQHELLMRASITKNIQTLKTLDQSAQSQIQCTYIMFQAVHVTDRGRYSNGMCHFPQHIWTASRIPWRSSKAT